MGRADASIDLGTGNDTPVGESGNAPGGKAAYFVKEGSDTAALPVKTLGTSGREVNPIVEPILQAGVGNLVPRLHFPSAKVHFLEAGIGQGIGIAARRSKQAATGKRAGVNRIESGTGKTLTHEAGFVGEGRGEGHVRPAVAGAGRHIDLRVADEGYLHRLKAMTVPK